MKYLSLLQVLQLYQEIINQTGGTFGIRDLGALESAIAQPQMTFEGEELYKTLAEKAAALSFSLSTNHPFVDGNKRVAHAAMEIFLLMNGFEIQASIDEQESMFLKLASGKVTREKLTAWIDNRIKPGNKKSD